MYDFGCACMYVYGYMRMYLNVCRAYHNMCICVFEVHMWTIACICMYHACIHFFACIILYLYVLYVSV